MKTKSLQVFLVLYCLALSLSCEKEEQLNRNEEPIKTVTLDQALEVIKITQQKISTKSNTNFITSISKEINFEAITNTDQELAVIPVNTVYKNLYSRIVLLEIEGELQSAILSLNTFESSTSENFSGEILITDMNGNFIKGLRIKNNRVVSHYMKSNVDTDKKYLSFNTSDAKSDCDNDCPFSVCDYCTLDEVVVTVPREQTNYISVEVMFPQRDLGLDWRNYDYNYGGGSGPTNPEPDENEEDCNTFKLRVKNILSTEGGFVNDPADPGGATNKGISWPVWINNSQSVLGLSPTIENLRTLTDEDAELIYKELYWDKIYANDINDGDLRFLLFDFFVNAGGNAVKTLQRTLNNLGSNLVVDGVMGAQTVTEINNYENQIELYNNFKSNRQNYYDEITENSVDNYLDKNPDASQQEINDNTFEKFIDGWTNRVNEFKDKSQINNQDVNC